MNFNTIPKNAQVVDKTGKMTPVMAVFIDTISQLQQQVRELQEKVKKLENGE